MDFTRTTLRELLAGLQAGRFCAVDLLEHSLRTIDVKAQLNAFVAIDEEGARAAARASDRRRENGQAIRPLEGIPIGVKDLEDAIGLRTTHGSALYEKAPPAERDSPLTGRLRAAGAIVVGKTNTPEFGWTSETDNAIFGATRSPWDHDRTAGGSSGGSAAAVSGGMVPLATGSDCGGSIRIPAAACGIAGFKPSPGRIPMSTSQPPYYPTAGVAGPMARTIEDIDYAFRLVADPAAENEKDETPGASDGHTRIRAGWSPTLGYAEVDAELLRVAEDALGRLPADRFDVQSAEAIFTKDPIGTWLTTINAYNMRALSPHRGAPEWGRVHPELRALAETSEQRSAPDFVRALDDAWRLATALEAALLHRDVILCPTVAAAPPRVGQLGEINGRPSKNWVRLPYVFNLTESPVATVPVGLTADRLPVSIQVVGRRNADLEVLRIAAAVEQAIGLREYPPA